MFYEKRLWRSNESRYDIQTVVAETGDEAEFVKYIEVKSTKRVTVPDITDSLWIDTLNITRNEYIILKWRWFHRYRLKVSNSFTKSRVILLIYWRK